MMLQLKVRSYYIMKTLIMNIFIVFLSEIMLMGLG